MTNATLDLQSGANRRALDFLRINPGIKVVGRNPEEEQALAELAVAGFARKVGKATFSSQNQLARSRIVRKVSADGCLSFASA